MGREMSGLSTALGLFASPLLILSTESVVVMGWKGMSTSIAMWAALPEDMLQLTCSGRAHALLLHHHD